MFLANTIKDMLKGMLVFFSVTELDAVIRQERVNSIWQSSDQVAQELRRNPFAFLFM